jgi:2-polyprenyl-3-methyl-5-hydroxy-6-metoxy-1,4-benzoquinol methylase
VSDKQASFNPDLRYPVADQEGERWSLWKSLPMMELSARDTYQFVKEALPSSAQRILEVGCGDGYLALELARDGYDVTGIDKSEEIIRVAERTRAAHADTAGFGKLTYYCVDVNSWQAAEERFDAVVMTRTLHHLHDLQETMSRIQQLLTIDGCLICQDYAYDRLNGQTASWMYSMQRMLYLTGLSDENSGLAVDDAQSIEALRTAWLQRAEHRLNRYDEMLQALEQSFPRQFFSWVPYLFVYVGNGICHAAPEQERALLNFLKNMEQYNIEKEYMQAVGFRYVGRPGL